VQTEPTTTTIDHAQQTAARIAGFLYLFLMVIAIYAFSVRSSYIAAGDAAKTAGNIMASERLFRLTIAIDLITAAGDVALAVALYALLEPVNRSLALLGAFWRLAEAAIFAVIALMSIVVVLLLSGPRYLQAFSPDQLHALARLCLSAHGRGFSIGFIFLALGATVFSYLLLKSRYAPESALRLGNILVLGDAHRHVRDHRFSGFGEHPRSGLLHPRVQVVCVDSIASPRRRYEVLLTAHLVEPYYAQMVDPIPLTSEHLARARGAAAAPDVDAWAATIADILASADG
jgi:hypothetical protein